MLQQYANSVGMFAVEEKVLHRWSSYTAPLTVFSAYWILHWSFRKLEDCTALADHCWRFHTFSMVIRGSICRKLLALSSRKENILHLNNRCNMGSSRSNSLFVPHQLLPPQHERTSSFHEEGSLFWILISLLASFLGVPTKKPNEVHSAPAFVPDIFIFCKEMGKSLLHTRCQPVLTRKALMPPDPDSSRVMS